MIAHVSAPAIDPDPNRVASVSPPVVGLLKRGLGFNGVVVTDALDMNGLLKLFPPERGNPSGLAAVEAVKAGNDMVIIPADLDGTYNGLLNAVKNGEIPEARIDEAVLKLLKLKASVGLNKGRLVDLNALPRTVATPENVDMAQKISDAALTLVKDNGRFLPLRPSRANGTSGSHLTYKPEEEIRNRVVAVIFVDDVRLDSGRVLERQLRSRIRDANIFYVDTRFAAGMKPLILEAVRQAQVVIAAAAVIPSAGRTAKGQNAKGSVSLTGELSAVMSGILQTAADRTVVVALGNPYLAAEYPQIQNYICVYSNAPVSEMSAIKALFGEMPIRGHLPVTIPNIAQRGQGMERFVQPLTGGTNSNGKR
jgi:beta-N-acetylhexosaminidase